MITESVEQIFLTLEFHTSSVKEVPGIKKDLVALFWKTENMRAGFQ